jgi:predicted ATPase
VRNVIDSLHLKRFKNFQDATLTLGPLTILIGANASGKSNIRDAFRFLHGIGRGYSLADIFGESYVGGGQVWSGIRGGAREAAYFGSRSFELAVELRLPPEGRAVPPVKYRIEVSAAKTAGSFPRIVSESLDYPLVFGKSAHSRGKTGFQTVEVGASKKKKLDVALFPTRGTNGKDSKTYAADAPILFRLTEDGDGIGRETRALSRSVVHELKAFRFLDLAPAQMRIPSQLGQTILGDRGENLSSVLAAICADTSTKKILLAWIRKLTPMDVDELRFDQDAAGRILLRLVEKDGRSVSALGASDGTLRFLAILAAIFGPEPASFYFIEELENGIHPTRLGLLIDLIEHQAKRRSIQIVATSHSPQLLQFLSEESLEHASLVYRLPDHPDGRIKRIVDIPEARRVIKEQPLWVLHASSWFEDVLDLTEDANAEPVAGNQPAS